MYISLLQLCIQLRTDTPRFIKINKQDEESITKFQHEILNSSLLINLNDNPTSDANINYNTLHNIFQNAKNTHMPEKVIKFDKYKHKRSKWITQGIIKSIHFRDNLYKNHKMTDPISPDYTIMQINLKTYNNILKKDI